MAARKNHKEIVETLLRAGADKDRQDRDGYTPLHDAAITGHKEVVEILLRAGTDINQLNNEVKQLWTWPLKRGIKKS